MGAVILSAVSVGAVIMCAVAVSAVILSAVALGAVISGCSSCGCYNSGCCCFGCQFVSLGSVIYCDAGNVVANAVAVNTGAVVVDVVSIVDVADCIMQSKIISANIAKIL